MDTGSDADGSEGLRMTLAHERPSTQQKKIASSPKLCSDLKLVDELLAMRCEDNGGGW